MFASLYECDVMYIIYVFFKSEILYISLGLYVDCPSLEFLLQTHTHYTRMTDFRVPDVRFCHTCEILRYLVVCCLQFLRTLRLVTILTVKPLQCSNGKNAFGFVALIVFLIVCRG